MFKLLPGTSQIRQIPRILIIVGDPNQTIQVIGKTRNSQIAKRFPSIREETIRALKDEEGINGVSNGRKIVGAYEDAGEGDGEITGPYKPVTFCAVGYAAFSCGNGEVVVPCQSVRGFEAWNPLEVDE